MFKTFPEFSKLTLTDRKAYGKFVDNFPPVGSISFADLMTWWNPLGHMSISVLNGNLVIPYWLPGDEKHSGLSVIGTNKVDESICTVFDYLRERGERPRLVNVPEFVVASLQYPDMFEIKEERRYDEYIVGPEKFFPLENMSERRRRRVSKQLREVGEENIEIRVLDLSLDQNRDLLLAALMGWQKKNINNYGKLEQEASRASIAHAEALGIENICLFINDELHGFCLYQTASDGAHVILNCVKATHKSSLGFELIAYEFTKWFVERGFKYANLNADYGLLHLRIFMLTLGPVNSYRKYSVEPA